jgi:PIN domain nuclease of toxin-antitoxin system
VGSPTGEAAALILLDAYALHAFVVGEEAADEVEQLLRTGPAAVVATNLAEIVDGLVRKEGWSDTDVVERLGMVVGPIVEVRPVADTVGWRAGLLRARHYRRTSCPVSLADCVLLASARPGERIATADPAVAAVARAEGIGLVPLPDTSGRRP